MAKTIEMEKWDNGEGVTLIFHHEDAMLLDKAMPWSRTITRMTLDFSEVDKVLALLQDYQRTPSPAVRIAVPSRPHRQ